MWTTISKRTRHIVTTWLVKRLLKAVTEDDILVMTQVGWFIGRHKMSSEEIITLKEEALSFEKSSLYRLMKRDLRYAATLQRYNEAKNDLDMLFGKSMLYNFDLIRKYIAGIIKN